MYLQRKTLPKLKKKKKNLDISQNHITTDIKEAQEARNWCFPLWNFLESSFWFHQISSFTLHNLVNRISFESQYWFYYISWYTELISLISSFTSLSIFICILKAYTSIFLACFFIVFTFNETRVDYHYDNNDLCWNLIHFMLASI